MLAGTPLAAMERLGDAASEMNDDLPFHQVAVAWRDARDVPSHRIDIRRGATAGPFARCGLRDLDVPDDHLWWRARQPRGVAERPHDGDGVSALVKRGG